MQKTIQTDCVSINPVGTEGKESWSPISSIASLTQDRLHALFDYPEDSDWLIWKLALSRRIRVGEPAGSIHHTGYVWVRIEGNDYPAHLLCWLWTHGEIAKVDHADRVPWNNRITNLRKATRSQNMFNRQLPSKLGVRGVYATRNGTFEARIQVDGVPIQIGTFRSIEEASLAYKAMAKQLYGEFANDI